MFKILFYSMFVILSSYLSSTLCKHEDSFLDDTELLMTFMVARHGDRSPIEMTVKYVTDKEKVMNLIQKIGYGQLTNAGKRTGYKVGAFIRHRYDGLLSREYNKSEIYIRSTDSTRSKMTILTAMAAVYPVEENWCKDLGCKLNNWSPVPYTTESPVYDFNLAVINCPKFITALNDVLNRPAPEMAKYNKFLDRWSNLIGVNITVKPYKSYLIYDVYNSQRTLGVPLSEELDEMFPEIEEVAGAAIEVVFGKEYVSLAAGPLLRKFFEAANKTISGEDVPKVHVYSAHDVNVYTFMVVTKVKPLPGAPKYGTVYALELRRVLATGQYIVVPVYLKTPHKFEVSYPQIEGCEGFCQLSKFHELVSQNALDVKEWRKQCEWSEDYDFDLNTIA